MHRTVLKSWREGGVPEKGVGRDSPKIDLPYSHLHLRLTDPHSLSIIHLLSYYSVPETVLSIRGVMVNEQEGTDLFLIERFDYMPTQLSRYQASIHFPTLDKLMYSHQTQERV